MGCIKTRDQFLAIHHEDPKAIKKYVKKHGVKEKFKLGDKSDWLKDKKSKKKRRVKKGFEEAADILKDYFNARA